MATGPATTFLVAALVASPATRHLPTGVVHCPRSLLGHDIEAKGLCGRNLAQSRAAGLIGCTAALRQE